MSDKVIDLHERSHFRLSTTGKVFVAGIAAWLVGQKTRLKIRGSREDVEKLAAALVASRRFQDELSREGATAESVIEKLGLKNATAREFTALTGVPWPG